jgi:DNA-binding transcriptional LysR family regulator
MDSRLVSQLAQADLNLLTVFQAVDSERSVTRAARVLGLSQPAVSHALRRLRLVLDDALFVKTSTGLVPTPRATQIAEGVRAVLLQAGSLILEKHVFEPSKLQRNFRVWSTDMVQNFTAPGLLKIFENEAPLAQAAFMVGTLDLPRVDMEQGKIDLAIGGFFKELPDGFYQQTLFRESFVCAVRAGHPRLGRVRKIGLDAFCQERHLLIAPGGTLKGAVDTHLAKKKRKRFIAMGLAGFSSAAWVLSETDSILTAPSRLVRQFQQRFDLKVFEPPLPLPELNICQIWHERNNRDPAHRWFREQVCRVLQD